MNSNRTIEILRFFIRRAWLVVAFVAVPIFLVTMLKGTSGKIITSDGNAYYAWLSSIAADQDLDFRNDFMKLYAPDPDDWIENLEGRVKNVTPPGMAVVMAPGFLLAHTTAKLSNAWAGTHLTPYDAFYKNITALWLLVVFLLGVASFQKILETWNKDENISGMMTLAVVLGTNVIHYIAKEPSMGHATVFSLSALATRILLDQKNSAFKLSSWLAAGALLGLLMAVRNSTVVLLPWWIALGLLNVENNWSSRLRAGLCATAAAVMMFAVQPLMLSLMTEHLTLNGYPTYGFSSGFDGIWRGLISSRHGLIAYHPLWVVIFSAMAIAIRIRELRAYTAAAAMAFSMAVLINGTWPFWWFGDSFGNRAYIDVLVPCATVAGAAIFIGNKKFESSKARVAGVLCSAAFVGANLVLWLGYLLRRYPSDGLHSYREAWLWWLR